MRIRIGLLTACLLAGCAGSPPKPPQPQGEFRPVNRPMAAPKAETFNFAFEGDFSGVLIALKEASPQQIQILPTEGQATPVPVRVNLKNTTLENALRQIGAQGSGLVDVVWSGTGQGGLVSLRYHARETNVFKKQGS